MKMKKDDEELIEDIKMLLKKLQIESVPYLSVYINLDMVDKYIHLTHAREWLLMAASDADEAITFDIAAKKSKTADKIASCQRMCQSKLATMRMYYERAMPWYEKYLKAVCCDNAELAKDSLVA